MTGTRGISVVAKNILDAKVEQLRHLSYDAVCQLPAASGDEVAMAGHTYAVTIYRHDIAATECLLVVQVAAPTLLGLGGRHWERGVVFRPGGGVREASERELEESGN